MEKGPLSLQNSLQLEKLHKKNILCCALQKIFKKSHLIILINATVNQIVEIDRARGQLDCDVAERIFISGSLH